MFTPGQRIQDAHASIKFTDGTETVRDIPVPYTGSVNPKYDAEQWIKDNKRFIGNKVIKSVFVKRLSLAYSYTDPDEDD